MIIKQIQILNQIKILNELMVSACKKHNIKINEDTYEA